VSTAKKADIDSLREMQIKLYRGGQAVETDGTAAAAEPYCQTRKE
jgi:hypothetical protein